MLMNERERKINNTIELCGLQRDACIGKLNRAIGKQTMKECQEMIETNMEGRHQNTLERQRTKLNRLFHKTKGGRSNSNIGNIYTNDHSNTVSTIASNTPTGTTTTTTSATKTGRWIKNLSSTSLTKA